MSPSIALHRHILSATLVTAALGALALLGPPRLTLIAAAPGAPIGVTVVHSSEVDHVQLEARIVQRVDGRRTEHPGVLREVTGDGADGHADRRQFQLRTPDREASPAVIIVRGTHGTDGPFMEGMLRLNASGAVVGISYSKRKSLLGGSTFTAFSERDIDAALRALDTDR